MAIITIFNQKGGVAKTTTTLNLCAALAQRGDNPLSIDLDPQAHLSYVCGVRVERPADSIYAFYDQAKSLTQLIRPARGGWLAIPAHFELSKVDTKFGKGPTVLNRLKVGINKENLGNGRPVLIDCSPMLGVLSLSAIFAADRLLIPVSTDYLALHGVSAVERTLKALEQVLKRRVARRYVVTRFDRRRKMSRDIYQTLKKRHGEELCSTRISENVSLAESPSSGTDVFAHAPGSRGAADYQALVCELTESGFFDEQQVVAKVFQSGRLQMQPSLSES